MADIDTDVLVVGAGPAGLALALELGIRGIQVQVVERNKRGGLAPRAKTTNVRTRTHLRRWGIADALAAASPLGIDYPNDIHFVTSLTGHRLAVFHDAFNAAPGRNAAYPEHAQWVPQYTLERVMLERAQALGTVNIRFGTTFVFAEQDDESVTATVATGEDSSETIKARYLIGADGARSAVRDLIGAKMQGSYGLSRNYNIVVRAPGLEKAHDQGPGVMYLQIGANGLSIIGPMDEGDIWYFGAQGPKDGVQPSNEDLVALIKSSTGIDLPYEILSADQWVASELLADRYSQGRIILAGDACHLHPPFGGYGMNMGVGDGVDLGWKIAAELQGWAGRGLVGTYETERRPVHEAVMAEAVANHAMIVGSPWRDGLDEDTPEGQALRAVVGAGIQIAKAREYHTLGTVLGLGYEVSPIIDHEDEPVPARDGQVYRPDARPGSLAPHLWLADGRSLYDEFGPGFAIVATDDADERQIGRAVSEAHALGAPICVVRPGLETRALYKSTLTLVRPDQYVAWRGEDWSDGALRRACASPTATQ